MKETTQNNILLAEFLGVKQKENNWFDGYELQKAGLPFDYGVNPYHIRISMECRGIN